jgi:hypothetical protein
MKRRFMHFWTCSQHTAFMPPWDCMYPGEHAGFASRAYRVDHPDGDYTIVLGSVVAGPCVDSVMPDYSFLDGADLPFLPRDGS